MVRVFGYACLHGAATSASLRRWRDRIGTYCVSEGLGAVELVFIDSGLPDTTWSRPGWAALLDVLDLYTSQGDGSPVVVVPSLAHLSTDSVSLQRMRVQLDHAGVWTVAMPKTPPHRRPRDRTRSPPARGGGA
jgi:hypothetical protein